FTGNSPVYSGNVDNVTGQLLPDQQPGNPSTPVAPVAPVIASFSTDSGTVGDGTTNDNTLTLSGNATANSTLKKFDGSTQIGASTADASGAWSYNTATLTDGTHSFSVSATASGTTTA